MPNLCAAACSGVFIHGAAGDYCYNKYGPYGYSPCEVADAVPHVLKEIETDRDIALTDRNLFGMMEPI
jgi:ADP-dependent NAD(P)H-hydrate dehydratase / NAD(P)H-hydrate epimerase